MEEDLVAMLLADAGIAGVVGERVNWDTLPQGSARPAIVLYVVAGVPDYAMSRATGLVSTVVQADCQGGTKAAALAASRALTALLSGFRGSSGNTRFDGAFIQSERHTFEKPDDGSEAWHEVSIDFAVWHGSLT